MHFKQPFSTRSKLFTIIAAIFLLAGLAIVLVINENMRSQARRVAEDKARIILDQNLATHTYFTHQLKPTLFKWSRSFRNKEFFEPVWMSSTYAVREMDKYFQDLHHTEYMYKESAINARSPANEADTVERGFLEQLNQNPELVKKVQIRQIKGKTYFEVLRKGEVMQKACLRCHSRPDQAPQGLIQKYGPDRSFDREQGDAISAISIRIPLEKAYAYADRVSFILICFIIGLLVLVYFSLYLINQRLIFSPLKRLKDKAQSIARGQEAVGQEIEDASSQEINELTQSFNAMSRQLKKQIENLDERVRERTAELNELNEDLKAEIQSRKEAETALRQEKEALQKALMEVSTLKGLLPICANCKMIRDDQGYWSQIEAYIEEHSQAEFSHSICPDCAKELYPDLDLK